MRSFLKMSRLVSAVTVVICAIAAVGLLADTEGQNQQVTNHFNLHDDCLSLLNTQISWEMYASIVYMNIGAYFEKPSVGKIGFAQFFKDQSREEYDHAQKIIEYITKRDGTVKRITVDESPKNEWSSPLDALNDAIKLENHVYAKLQYIYDVSEQKCQDGHLSDYLVTNFFSEQVESISELTEMMSRLNVKDPVAASTIEYLVDKDLRKGSKKEL